MFAQIVEAEASEVLRVIEIIVQARR